MHGKNGVVVEEISVTDCLSRGEEAVVGMGVGVVEGDEGGVLDERVPVLGHRLESEEGFDGET